MLLNRGIRNERRQKNKKEKKIKLYLKLKFSYLNFAHRKKNLIFIYSCIFTFDRGIRKHTSSLKKTIIFKIVIIIIKNLMLEQSRFEPKKDI